LHVALPHHQIQWLYNHKSSHHQFWKWIVPGGSGVGIKVEEDLYCASDNCPEPQKGKINDKKSVMRKYLCHYIGKVE
jgi:hypothetical protein